MKKWLLICISVALSLPTYGQEINTDSTYAMESVTVIYNAIERTPITFTTISKTDIDRVNIGQEPSSIFSRYLGMTSYSDGGNAMGYSFFRMRGIDQTRLNVTLDGVPLNEPEDQGIYFSNIPDILTSMESVQLQRGVGLTQNGIASFGGSIQLTSPNITRERFFNVGGGYGSYNSSRIFAEYNNGLTANGIGLYVRASKLNTDGFRDNVDNESSSIFISTGMFRKNWNTKLVTFIGKQENGMGWLGSPADSININPRHNSNTKRERDSFVKNTSLLQSTFILNDNAFLKNTIYYTQLYGNYDFDLDAFLGLRDYTNLVFNYDLSSSWFGSFTNFVYTIGNVESLTGIHLNTYQRTHIGSEVVDGILYENTGYRRELSGHQRLTFGISNVSLMADLQLRYTDFDYSGDVAMDRLDWLFLNSRYGITYELQNSALYFSVGMVGREPTRNDMFGGEDNFVELFSTKAERVTNYEVGFRSNESVNRFNINLYYMDFRNEITLNGQFGPNSIALTQNVEQSYRSGIEADYSAQLRNVQLLINGSLNRHRITDQSNTFQPILSPTMLLNSGIFYTMGRTEVGLFGKYQSSSYIDFTNENSIDGFYTMDVQLHRSFNNLLVSFYANNILDRHYFTSGYVDMFDGSPRYHINAFRNYYVAVSYKF